MELFATLAEKGLLAAFAAVLLWMQMQQDTWMRNYMQELRKSIDKLTNTIEKRNEK